MSDTNSLVDVAMRDQFACGRPSKGVAELITSCKNSMPCSEPSVSLANSPLEVAVQNSCVSMDRMSDAECLDLRFGSVNMNDFNLGDVKVVDTCTNSGLCSGPVVSHASLPMIVAVHNSVGSASMCDFDIGDVEPSALNVVWEALMYRSINNCFA